MNRIVNSENATNEIMNLFEKYGKEDYDGEPVSQTSHMSQCAMQAMSDGAQTINPAQFAEMMKQTRLIAAAVGRTA